MITSALRATRWRALTHSQTRSLTTIGIRREDPSRVWERRAPLTPQAVQSLLSTRKDLEVEVESCQRRCFPNESYQQVRIPTLAYAAEADQVGRSEYCLGIIGKYRRRIGDKGGSGG
jgi:alpha-aminoadipic semialdehyde synthase